MKRYLLYIIALLSLTSCNEWLDVRSETEAKEEDLFAKKNGFCNALTGIYMNLADRSGYGEALTMSVIEELAHNWLNDSYDYNVAYYYICRHEYTNSECKAAIKPVYENLYNSVVKTNVLIKNLEDNADALQSYPQLKGCIEGEAHAIKALCQFDILRLFGQLPNGQGTRKVRLPYSFTTTITDIPSYYDYDEYVKLIFNDLDKAIELLGKYDPALKYSLGILNSPASLPGSFSEDYLTYRRERLNYWAVKGLRARINLYLGNTEAAYKEALEVINARTEDGDKVAGLNAQSNLDAGYYTLPSESLFSLSKYDMFTYTNGKLFGYSSGNVTPNSHLVVTQAMLTEIFKGVNTASNNRYNSLWNRKAMNNQGQIYPALCKYYYNTSNGTASSTMQALIPMVRLSEMYLIAMETTKDLNEANTLYDTYMRDHNTLLEEPVFKSLDEVRTEVIKEYRREFYAEGHMFYTYKRLFTKKILWQTEEMEENDYIIPVPDTEYERKD